MSKVNTVRRFGLYVHVILGTIMGILLAVGTILYVNAKFPYNIYGSYMVCISALTTGIYYFYQGIEKESPRQTLIDIFAEYMFAMLLSFTITFFVFNILWLCPYVG